MTYKALYLLIPAFGGIFNLTFSPRGRRNLVQSFLVGGTTVGEHSRDLSGRLPYGSVRTPCLTYKVSGRPRYILDRNSSHLTGQVADSYNNSV